MTRSRYRVVKPHAPHFLTLTVIQWLPLFGQPSHVRILLDSLTYLQANDGLVLYAYVILENHLHLVAESADLARDVARFKSFTARQIIDRLRAVGAEDRLAQLNFYKLRHKGDRLYQLWQEGAHPKLVQGIPMMRQKVAYIHNNPVRRGYVDTPVHWRYSSARNYAGLPGLLEVQTRW